MKDIDVSFISKLSQLTSVVIIVGKADDMTLREREIHLTEIKLALKRIDKSDYL